MSNVDSHIRTEQKRGVPEGWVETTLNEVLNISSGKTRPKISGDFPIYGGNGVLGYGNKFNQEEPTIIIGRVGAYCGIVFFEFRIPDH